MAQARTWILALVAGAVAFVLWWRLFDGPRVMALALRADPGLALAGLALMGAAQLLRLLRWHALLNRLGRVPLPRTFRLLYASEFLNNILPVKVGDLGRALALAARSPGFTVGSATASMVVDRLWGIAARLLALTLLLVVPSRLPASLRISADVFAAVLVGAIALVLVWRRYGGALARAGAPLLRFLPSAAREVVARTLRAFADATVEVGTRPGLAAGLFALSAGSLLAQSAAFALLFRAVGHPLPLSVALVGTALFDLLAVVPAPPAGVGTTEWYATLIFATGLGQPTAAAAAAALLYHAAWLLIVFVAGASSLAAVGEMLPPPPAGADRVTVVVGADGFVGGALASALGGSRVVFGAAREPGDTPFDKARPLLSGADVVVNASGVRVRPGLSPADYRRTHAETVARLVPALAPGSLLVQVSSASVLGRSPASPPPNDEAGSPGTFGCPDYAIAKRDAERAARAATSAHGVRLAILRPAILYGPVPDGMIGTLGKLAARGLHLRIVPPGHRHHLCALPLLVEVIRTVVRRGRGIETPLTVADPFLVTSAEIARLLREMHRPAVSLPFPAGAAGAVLRRFPRTSSPRLDLRTWGEILCILALDTVYDPAETYRLLGIDVSRFSRTRTWERLARGLEAET